MQQALSRYSVKGGALAVVKDGHLIFARGYGLADVEAQLPVQPDSLFRWCSISKTVTAAAVMHLVEQNKLDLDRPVFNILDQYSPYNGTLGDSRLSSITVRQLLHHTGGWDRLISSARDPVVADGAVRAAQVTGSSFPPSLDTVIRYMLAQRLDFDPGSRFAYSNFGYELLRATIEKVSGQSYQAYVRQTLLEPFGLARLQKGNGHLAGRLPGEVRYYDYPGAPLIDSYLSPQREKQPAPYGIMDTNLGEAAGAWVGSVVDLAKLASMLDGVRAPSIVSAGSFNSMIAEQPRSTWVDSAGWYGFGLFAQRQTQGISWNHGGYNRGSQTGFYHFPNGISYAYLFNGASQDAVFPSAYVAQALWDALALVKDFPERDEFPQFYGPRIAASGIVNAASFQPGTLAPDSLATILGVDLGGRDSDVSVSLRDSLGVEHSLQLLYGGPGQLNCVLPRGSAMGDATLTVHRAGWPDAEAAQSMAAVSPGLFTLNASGLAAASLVRGKAGQQTSWESVFEVDDTGIVVARPIAFAADDEVLTLVLYCTGVRGRTTQERVAVQLGDISLAVSYAGPQVQYPGLDQINVTVPRSLAGAGVVSVRVDVNGSASNVASLTFR